MPTQTIMSAQLTCSMGSSPAKLAVAPSRTVQVDNKLAATIMDFAPTANIPPFGMCKAPTNPQVITATAAASGVLTPQPCLPATTAPWVAGAPTVLIDSQIALNNPAKLMCQWLGVITISDPGQSKMSIP